MIKIPVFFVIIFTLLLYSIAFKLRLQGLPESIYVFIATVIFTIALVIDYIRKEIKYRKFCRDFLGLIKLSIVNRENDILDELMHLNNRQVKSRVYYPGFSYWFDQVFIPSYNVGDRDVITVRDKRYGTLLGFALLKVGAENKICNLSPLVDGVGMTQTILDSALLYYNRDFTIDVPITPETIKLHSKLHSLGFEALHHGLSKDHVSQITYIKDRNLGWI